VVAPHSIEGIVETLAPLYRDLAAYAPARQGYLAEKLAARYLPRAGVRRVELPDLLAACREGRRRDPFWLVARP
jgi:hypothetical protein